MSKKTLKRDLFIWALVFGVLTIPFIFFNIDIACQRPFYHPEEGWFLAKIPFWDFIYKYGIFLGYFLVVGALVMMSISYWKKVAVKWRRPAFFLLFVMILGPGVLVNGVLKEHWGHPRPREIKEFDGTEDFVKVWVKGPTNGKSFPCGHASMGFFMSIPFLFLRKNYKKWAWSFFIFGTLYGLLIGFARMIAGGHFAGDVLWAAGIVWLTGILAYHFMNVNKLINVADFNSIENKKKRRTATVLMGIVLPILTIGLLLATPYISSRKIDIDRNDLNVINMKQLDAELGNGIVNVDFGNDFKIDFSVNAFGFPNSKVRFDWIASDTAKVVLTAMGWFTEFRNEIEIQFPENCNWQNKMNVVEGDVYLTVPNDTIARNLSINVIKGNIILMVQEDSEFTVEYAAPKIENETGLNLAKQVNGAFNVSLTIKEEGTLFIKSKP